MTTAGLSKWCTTLWNIPCYDSAYCPCLESEYTYKDDRIHHLCHRNEWMTHTHTHTHTHIHAELHARIDGPRTQLRSPGTFQEKSKVLITWTEISVERSGKTPIGRSARNWSLTTCKVAEYYVRFSLDRSKTTEERKATNTGCSFCFFFCYFLWFAFCNTERKTAVLFGLTWWQKVHDDVEVHDYYHHHHYSIGLSLQHSDVSIGLG